MTIQVDDLVCVSGVAKPRGVRLDNFSVRQATICDATQEAVADELPLTETTWRALPTAVAAAC
jgi:hypothetical protein